MARERACRRLNDCPQTAPSSPDQGWLDCLGITGWLASESGSPALCVVCFRSCGHEDALPEEVKACTAVHGALDRLQPGDLALRGAGAPGRGDGGDHGRLSRSRPRTKPSSRVHGRSPSTLPEQYRRCRCRGDARAGDRQRRWPVCRRGPDLARRWRDERRRPAPWCRADQVACRACARSAGTRAPASRGMADRVRCSRALLAAALRRPARDGPHAAAVALGTEFTPELCAVAAALRPATGEIGLVRPDIAGLLGLVVRRRSAGFQPAIDRGQAGTDGTADRMARQTQPMQPHHFLIAELAVISSVRPQAFLARSLRWPGSAGAVVPSDTARAA